MTMGWRDLGILGPGKAKIPTIKTYEDTEKNNAEQKSGIVIGKDEWWEKIIPEGGEPYWIVNGRKAKRGESPHEKRAALAKRKEFFDMFACNKKQEWLERLDRFDADRKEFIAKKGEYSTLEWQELIAIKNKKLASERKVFLSQKKEPSLCEWEAFRSQQQTRSIREWQKFITEKRKV